MLKRVAVQICNDDDLNAVLAMVELEKRLADDETLKMRIRRVLRTLEGSRVAILVLFEGGDIHLGKRSRATLGSQFPKLDIREAPMMVEAQFQPMLSGYFVISVEDLKGMGLL